MAPVSSNGGPSHASFGFIRSQPIKQFCKKQKHFCSANPSFLSFFSSFSLFILLIPPSLPYLFGTSAFFFSSTGFLLPIILFSSYLLSSHHSPSPHFRVLALRSETVRQELFGFLCTTFEASENYLT
ncbi:hypothetical protein Csa_001994 [Cucumis sativus]|uniref:Transmembrane protein n=1 Tax=Cucumis sativus TaxID=3659 RepID=A0A0A0LGZ7_CUCSA|nr:hypothetical protein Csa_001994 [Cucumis sativus]